MASEGARGGMTCGAGVSTGGPGDSGSTAVRPDDSRPAAGAGGDAGGGSPLGSAHDPADGGLPAGRGGAAGPRPPHRVVWTVTETDIGPLLLAATGRGLVQVTFHATGRVRAAAPGRLAGRLGAAPAEDPGSPLLAEPVRQVREYFAGRRRTFALPLDWSLIAGFSRAVLRELATGVPYGTVVGYGDLARRVGQPGAAQAVGVAMASNPLPVVVPCHRVIESDGGIGGFGGDVETKRKLLALEGVLPEPLF